ncbi:MAG: FG-GAP-like repeat-containing protein [Bacteroidota bacterium]
MPKLLLLICLLAPLTALSQFTYDIDQSIPVRVDGQLLPSPWAGGLNSTQYSTMDLNNDGIDDLVLFDRTSSKVSTFLNTGNAYEYSPEYEAFFPDNLRNWMLLRDYNCDGRKDLFTDAPLGIRLLENVTTDGNLEWEEAANPILTVGFSGNINLQLQGSDIPGIEDLDNDGDLDILVYRFAGASTIEFHQNRSIEDFGTCDTLAFVRVTQRWGGMEDCNCGVFSFNDISCSDAGGRVKKTEHVGGKSILTLDQDNDGDHDLVVSEEDCTQFYFMENEGTAVDASFQNFSTAFPNATNPINVSIFPAAYYEDVDFDDVKDIVVTPNVSSSLNFQVNFRFSNFFYKNVGTNENPVFSFNGNNFLQNQMIEVGENAVPAFADYDNDGDLDMFVGNLSQFTINGIFSSIWLFENTGTATDPEFTLIDEDYLFLSIFRLLNIKPQFVDLNNDGRLDLTFVANQTAPFITRIFFAINQGNGVFDFNGQGLNSLNIPMTLTENHHFTHIDSDGQIDLLITRTDGSLNHYRNESTGENLLFRLEEESFLGLGSSPLRRNFAVYTDDMDNDGQQDLVTADFTGRVTIYSDFLADTENLGEGVSDIVVNPLTETPTAVNLGGKIWPVPANIFGTNKPAIVAGSSQGGLRVLKNTDEQIRDDIGVEVRLSLFPNPISPALNNGIITVETNQTVLVEVISALGQRIIEPILLSKDQPIEINSRNLSSGLYIVRAISEDNILASAKFIVSN